MTLHVEFDREEDGRWISEIGSLSGCLVYGSIRVEALLNVAALALRILADRLER